MVKSSPVRGGSRTRENCELGLMTSGLNARRGTAESELDALLCHDALVAVWVLDVVHLCNKVSNFD